jgi:hypothetical protein
VIIWKILYSNYDLGGLLFAVIGLAIHAFGDLVARKRR